jgi:hypothetical protein
MIVQWCIKGLSLSSDEESRAMFHSQSGIQCNWWRRVTTITPSGIREKLTAQNVDMHVNHFTRPDPSSNLPFNENTPFISLSAGTVERDAVARTNYVHRARKTALFFGTEFGQKPKAYLYVCWVILAPRASAEVENLAEEVRDLNSYRHYSPFQTEGEILAKIHIPDNQIRSVERWELDAIANRYRQTGLYENPRFTPPGQLTNVRGLI